MPQPQRPNRNDAPWTPEDYTASRTLLRLWKRKSKELQLTQNKLARQWEITQGAVSRYINGIIKLNPEMVLKFAKSLDCDPTLIDPRMSELVRTKKNDYIHSILVKTNAYEPRIFHEDWITIDTRNKPKPGRLVAAHDAHTLIIGVLQNNHLVHPITHQPQPINDSLMLHNIEAIIPKESINGRP